VSVRRSGARGRSSRRRLDSVVVVFGRLVLATRQLDQSPTGQLDVDKQQQTDGDDDDRPEQTVYGVRLRVGLAGNGVVERLGVVETAEGPADWKPTDVPLHVVVVLGVRLVTDVHRTLQTRTQHKTSASFIVNVCRVKKVYVHSFSRNGVHCIHNAHSVFSARQHAKRAICYRPSVCPSLRPSVTRADQSKTVEVRIMQFSPHSSLIPLVFAG